VKFLIVDDRSCDRPLIAEFLAQVPGAELFEGASSPEGFAAMLEHARARRRIVHRVPRGEELLAGLIGTSSSMLKLRSRIRQVAASTRPLLVTGPTGAGKELVVRSVHALSARAAAPLLDLNCGAFPEALIESQLFGHEKGSFTNADRKHDGFFASVGEGTLFLDEIGELPMELQAKLLRVLETSTFRPIGCCETRQFRGRIIAATHVDLESRVEQGTFRVDLYYRLNVLDLRVPSLEDRREDIPELVAHFAALQERELLFTTEALAMLSQARWPGNVRQLRNAIDRLAVLGPLGPICVDALDALNLEEPGRRKNRLLSKLVGELLGSPAANKLELMEEALTREAMHRAQGNKSLAARLLGVHRKVIERCAEKWRLSAGEWSETSTP
jgi:DNA-binding NtrC family response regulator